MCKSNGSMREYWAPWEMSLEDGFSDSDLKLAITDEINYKIGLKKGAGRGDRDCYHWSQHALHQCDSMHGKG